MDSPTPTRFPHWLNETPGFLKGAFPTNAFRPSVSAGGYGWRQEKQSSRIRSASPSIENTCFDTNSHDDLSQMASFQLISDIHLEAPPTYDLFDIPSRAPYLALLGDIGNVTDDRFFTFVEAQLRKFQVVFLLFGNHEPYRLDWATAKDRVRKFSDSIHQKSQQAQTKASEKLGEFVFLDRTRCDLSSKVTVLGCTLHSRVVETQQESVSSVLNDFYSIKNWTVEDHCAAHETDLAWLNNQVTEIARSDPHRRIVIFSHHSPTIDIRAADPVHVNSPITSAFATDLRGEPCWEKPQVRLWAFGHTHYNCDFVEDRTGKRIVTNQRGYYFAQSKGYDAELVVRI